MSQLQSMPYYEENSFDGSFIEVSQWKTLLILIYRIRNFKIDQVFAVAYLAH